MDPLTHTSGADPAGPADRSEGAVLNPPPHSSLNPSVGSAVGASWGSLRPWLRLWTAMTLRLLRTGGLRGPLAIGTALGTVVGLGAIPVVRHLLDPGEDPVAAAARAGDLGVLVVAVTWCLAVAMDAAQGTRDGTRVTTLVLAPDRRHLLLAQAGAAAVVGACATVVVSLLVGVPAGGVVLDGHDAAGWGVRLLTGTLASAISTALLAAMAVCVGLLTRHPAVALLVLLLWWVALPMALNSGGVLLPDGGTTVTSVVAHIVPSSLGGATFTGDDRATTLAAGHVGLALWTAALLALADVVTRRTDAVWA